MTDSIHPAQGPDFVVNTVNTKEDLLAVSKLLMPSYFTIGYPVLGILLLVCGALLSVLKQGVSSLTLICFAVGALTLVLRSVTPKRAAARQIARLEESYGSDTLPSRLVFWPEGVVLNNCLSGGSVNLRYESIAKLLRTEHHLALRTKQNQVIVIRMSDLADVPELAAYLAAKCPQAKKKGF